jgi:acetyl esterase/lipase
MMTADGALGCAAAYLQGHPADDPLASPVHADLDGFPPLMLQVGSTEMFLDDSIRLAQRAGDANVRCTVEIWPGAFHVWQRWAPALSEGRAAVRSAGRFLKTHAVD